MEAKKKFSEVSLECVVKVNAEYPFLDQYTDMDQRDLSIISSGVVYTDFKPQENDFVFPFTHKQSFDHYG